VAERPDKAPKIVNLALDNPNLTYEFRTGETPDERASRLRREEAEADHKIRKQEAEDAHQRKIELIVVAVVYLTLLASLFIAAFKDPKTGLPEKAMTIIAGIVGALAGYLTGKKSK
jgi:hypothetical protein